MAFLLSSLSVVRVFQYLFFKSIFNLSLPQRIFRTLWKQAAVSPMFKNEKTALVNN